MNCDQKKLGERDQISYAGILSGIKKEKKGITIRLHTENNLENTYLTKSSKKTTLLIHPMNVDPIATVTLISKIKNLFTVNQIHRVSSFRSENFVSTIILQCVSIFELTWHFVEY